MMRRTWEDLSDSELRQRLERRGVDPAWASAAVRRRDHPSWAKAIDDKLWRPA